MKDFLIGIVMGAAAGIAAWALITAVHILGKMGK